MAAFGNFDEDSGRGFHIPSWLFVLVLVGAGFWFFQHYGISGLDAVSIYEKEAESESQEEFISYNQAGILPGTTFVGTSNVDVVADEQPHVAPQRIRNIRIASWALDGFTPSKLANPIARQNLIRIIHQFDIIALQQISSFERDLVPRIVDAANEAGRNYDYVIGETTGPKDHPEQLAFVFDLGRIKVDRTQTYSVSDPANRLMYDPLVAWFQAAQPTQENAWTFSLANVRVDLARAPQEVALMPNLMSAIRLDGRGEDDVVMAGLFQADDAYLIPTLSGPNVHAAVRSVPTDIFGRHQTSNVIVDSKLTSEYIGRGGAFNFMRAYELSLAQAETVSSHLPVFAEFTPTEGGEIAGTLRSHLK